MITIFIAVTSWWTQLRLKSPAFRLFAQVCSDADQRKYLSSASLTLWGEPVDSPHKGPVPRKMFPFDDVIMSSVNVILSYRADDLATQAAQEWHCPVSLRIFKYQHLYIFKSLWLSMYARVRFCLQVVTLLCSAMMTSSNGSLFRVTGLCARNSPVTGEFPAQRPVTRSFDVSFICAWIKGLENNREAGDFRRHRAHYDVIVMAVHSMKHTFSLVLIMIRVNYLSTFFGLLHWQWDKYMISPVPAK